VHAVVARDVGDQAIGHAGAAGDAVDQALGALQHAARDALRPPISHRMFMWMRPLPPAISCAIARLGDGAVDAVARQLLVPLAPVRP
jgi:hypothetical protein